MNPYQIKLDRAEKRLARLESERNGININEIPGTFATGRSGVPRGRMKKLDQQLDRTIDNAVALVAAKRQVEWLRVKWDLYDRGLIHANGRPVSTKPPVKSPRPQAEKDKAKAVQSAMNALDFDGVVLLNTGHRVVGWKIDHEQSGMTNLPK